MGVAFGNGAWEGLLSVPEEQPTDVVESELFGDSHSYRMPLANNSITCNPKLGLEALFGDKRWPVGALSPPLSESFVLITFIYVYILGSFHCIRFPY